MQGLMHIAVLAVCCYLCGAAVISQECIYLNGVEYRGEQHITSTGGRCLNWFETERDYNITLHLDSETGVGNHSYCRNPDGDSGPWCYVAIPGEKVEKEYCAIETCKDAPSSVNESEAPTADGNSSTSMSSEEQMFEDAKSLPSMNEAAAVQPVIGISQRVRVSPKQKKDLGTLGYVMGIIMMVIIIVIGVGITLGYLYKRGRDLKKQHDQMTYEREMQRITLPLSAFTNPTCELMDENTVVVHTNQTPVEETTEGNTLLTEQAGTPGA
ncbi:phosphoinositide-3-kinase-interacting protein 1 [Latimeria chalumnae]|uniref:phosphoinositide-3-kinase-interacting protein 1 n=1 Tax=Latimeria chalumnae TaxID=7897 RepID=UPI0006D8FD9F|nr:PREDICTED: phosphoinositide-3-kinase-interacting protein 1 [Latimeria chalumnae]|eukprot:XP_014344886.1 PREDICTED: phosphoinositide-3-kinase-interacting protein 1 [Latimeria chalumnae]